MSKQETYLFKYGGGWGNRIEFNGGVEKRKVVGWKPYRPKDGDLLLISMQNGKKALFKFKNVEELHDPKDMFFADIEDVGYEDDPKVIKHLSSAKTPPARLFL